MTDTMHIENAVLGGGEAGKYLAWDLAQQGRPVVVIERALIGGSCPNIACLPSKNVIRSAKVASLASQAASYGVRIEGTTVDMAGVRQRKRTMVDALIIDAPEEVLGRASGVSSRRRIPCWPTDDRREIP